MSKPFFWRILLSFLAVAVLCISCTKDDPNVVPDKYFIYFNLTNVGGSNIFTNSRYDADDLKARNVLRSSNSNFLSIKNGSATYIGLATDYQEIPVEFEFVLDDVTTIQVFLEIEGPAGLENLHLQQWNFYIDEEEVAQFDFANNATLTDQFKTYNKPPKNGLIGLASTVNKLVVLPINIF